MEKVISVIVPVYNVEKYLPECLESILGQSYRQLEIILINDGSTDESGVICDKYAKIDSRIKVIHQINGGAANAKNAGLRVATGEFLSFVDSDDYLEPKAYEFMIEKLKTHEADVVQCGFRNIYVDNAIEYITLLEATSFSTVEFLRRFTKDWTCGLLWDKLFRREIFNNIRFEEGHKIDDEFFTYQGIMNAKKIIHFSNIVYNYRKRKSSVMLRMESQQKIVLDKLEYLEKRRKRVIAKFPELKQDFDYHYLSMLVILSKDIATTEKSIKQTQYMLKKYFVEKEHCKVEFSLRKQLFLLQHRSYKKLLEAIEDKKVISEPYQCFE